MSPFWENWINNWCPALSDIDREIAPVFAKEAFDYLDAPIERLGARNTPMPFSPNLEDSVLPKVDDIMERVRKAVG